MSSPALPSIDLRFRIQVDRPPELDFLGPTVRGLLGHGLRQVACGHGDNEAGRCVCGVACAYARLFEGASQRRALLHEPDGFTPPPPMVIEIDTPFAANPIAADGTIGFCVRVFGRAIEDADRVIDAVVARQRHGFGARSQSYELVELRREVTGDDDTDASDTSAFGSELTLHFLTPLSLRQGQCAQRQINPVRLVDAARRRDWLMRVLYGLDDSPMADGVPPPVGDNAFQVVTDLTHRWSMARRSGRQSRAVPMEGLLGCAIVSGNWQQEAWLARVGRLHLGKYAIFGFGQTRVQKHFDNMFTREPPEIGARNGPPSGGFAKTAS